MSNNVKRRWSHYNKSLVNRGSITFWIDRDLLTNEACFDSTKGRPRFKSSIIKAGWVLRTVYKLTFRSTQGFFSSLLSLLGSDMKAPDYTLFCKRGFEVASLLPKLSSRRPLELVIDASGLKIFGEGEWKTYKHGREKKRRWIKVHAAVDPKTGECIAAVITDEKGGDSSQLSALMKQSPASIKRVYADGAYDTQRCRLLLHSRGIEDIIPPRKTGRLHCHAELKNRNNALRELRGLGGDYELWKKLKGYGRRSLAETFFSRLKTLLGDKLASKKFSHQELESMLKIHALNAMKKGI